MADPLKSVYENESDIPEPLKEYYVAKDGKYTIVGVDGFKPNVEFENQYKALQAERKEKKALIDQWKPWQETFQGKTLDDVRAELEKVPVLEAAATSKDKDNKEKMDAIIETTVRNRIAPVEREVVNYKAKVAELEEVIARQIAADRRRTILDAVRQGAAADGSFHDVAYNNPRGGLMLMAEQIFTLDEVSGEVVVRDEIEGIAPGLKVKEALIELRNQHPYLAKNSFGGGASGGGGSGTGVNPFRSNNMTERGAFIKANEKNPEKWKALMKQAGLKDPMQRHPNK